MGQLCSCQVSKRGVAMLLLLAAPSSCRGFFLSQHCTVTKRISTTRKRPIRLSRCFASTDVESRNDDSCSFELDGVEIRHVMAPMVAQSDAPFRWLGRQYGCDLAFTQMLHAHNIVRDAKFRQNHIDVHDNGAVINKLTTSQQNCLGGDLEKWKPFRWKEGGPLVVQLAGHDPDTMVRAAHQILTDIKDDSAIAGFDVNLGCPQGIARKGRYGAFLMEESVDLVCDILRSLRSSLPPTTKVSAKIRLPPNPNDLEDRIWRMLDCGIDFLTVHGRTLHENKTRVGPCRLGELRQAVEVAQRHTRNFPVIANGGIETYQDVFAIQQATGAAATMSSEGLLENPALFSGKQQELTPRQLLHHQMNMARQYLDYCQVYPPLPGSLGTEGGSFNVVRAHLFKLLHRYLQCEPDLRDFLSRRETNTLSHAYVLLNTIQEKYNAMSDEELLQHASNNSSWYRRHWDASKRVKRRGDNYRQHQQTNAATLSMEERKRQAQERIAKLRQERLDKERSQHQQQQQQVAV